MTVPERERWFLLKSVADKSCNYGKNKILFPSEKRLQFGYCTHFMQSFRVDLFVLPTVIRPTVFTAYDIFRPTVKCIHLTVDMFRHIVYSVCPVEEIFAYIQCSLCINV